MRRSHSGSDAGLKIKYSAPNRLVAWRRTLRPDIPRVLTDKEFMDMMQEFKLAGQWMQEQLALSRAAQSAAGPEQGSNSPSKRQDAASVIHPLTDVRR
jgi:hypothetical protein